MAKNSPTHEVGDLINLRYEVVGILGRGGMSAVYKVKDQNLNGQLIALKLLDAALLRDTTNIERFRREAIIARQLDHPNIVRVYDFDVTEDGEYFLTMEYIEGRTLSDRLKDTSNPVSMNQLTAILYEIASALENAHKHGVVHRDLKPANVLLTKEGKVKIADFGLCRATCFDSALSSSGECLGTPAYMSPEQIRGENVDGRSDIYSLGMLAFEACQGAPPFKADTWFKTAEMHLRSPLPQLSPDFPEWYHEMVHRCAAKLPDERYDSARQLLDLLEEHLLHVPNPRRRQPSFNHYIAGAGAAACVLAVCAVIGVVGAQQLAGAKPKLHERVNIASTVHRPSVARDPIASPPKKEMNPMFDSQEGDSYPHAPPIIPMGKIKQLEQMAQNGPMGQMGQMNHQEQREEKGPKSARFICTRAGRTIEVDSIPEGRNWECVSSNQMHQAPMNQNAEGDPRNRQGSNRPFGNKGPLAKMKRMQPMARR